MITAIILPKNESCYHYDSIEFSGQHNVTLPFQPSTPLTRVTCAVNYERSKLKKRNNLEKRLEPSELSEIPEVISINLIYALRYLQMQI